MGKMIKISLKDKKQLKSSKVRKWIKEAEEKLNSQDILKLIEEEAYAMWLNKVMFGVPFIIGVKNGKDK